MLSIIVAKAKNNVIGKNNELIWHLPEDLKRFKALTTGKVIVMGRKTFESLGRVLPNRKHVIFTRNLDFTIENENVEVVHDLSEIQKYIDSEDECFVIGGGLIYNMLMPYADKIYVTVINQDFDGDTYFPVIDENEWKIEKTEKGLKNEDNPYDYEYIDYIRRTNK